ncbi:carbohydrate-binding module family 5 protein [Tylopilus felleus]
MVSFRSGVVAAITAFSLLGSIQAVPLADKLDSLSPSARDILKRSTPNAPHFVAYNDKSTAFPSASDLKGFNVFAIAFLLDSGPVDQAQNWQGLTADQRASYVNEYNQARISLIVSAFGPTQTPTSSGVDPTSAASTMADWVVQYGLNGIDVAYEDSAAFEGGTAENWLTTLTQQLRAKLPKGQYILTHAPVAPLFSNSMWGGGGYLAIEKSVGSLIDWYNVQFYDQGTSEYTTCDGLLTASSSAWPQSALFQIVTNGVDRDKLVIGKPATAVDASNGYMDSSTLATCVSKASEKYWEGGVMAWEFPDANSSWILTVRGSTWPVSDPTTTTPTTSTLTSTGRSGSDNCAGASAWDSGDEYLESIQVMYK